MRVLLNTKPFVLSEKTGVGYYVYNLYQELLKCDLEVIPTFGNSSKSFVNSMSKVSSYLRRFFPGWPPAFLRDLGDLFVGRLLRGKMNEPVYDIYHETSLDVMPEIKAKKVLNIYDLSFITCPEFLVKDFAESARANITKNALLADRIIVNTEFIKAEVINILGIPEGKIDVIPLAPKGLYCLRNKSNSLPPPVKRFTKKDYMLYVGTVEPRKNLKTLIRAFKDIRGKYDISLIIAGRLGWLYDDIVRYPDSLGIKDDVIFTRYVDEETILYLYNYASAFIYPSLYEGFGLPPLEAMSCRIPVIVSDIPPLREVVADAALSFNPHDHGELAVAIERVLSSETLRFELIQKGIKRVEEHSWGKVALSTIKTYTRVMES